MKKFVLSLLFLAVLAALIAWAGFVLRSTYDDICVDQVTAFHALEDNTAEVIAYGSSHCWNGFDAQLFQERFGVSAYNYSTYWQKINTTQLFFRDSLKTQSPRVALIETVYIGSAFVGNAEVDGELYYTRAMGPSRERREYLRQCFGSNLEAYLGYYVPLVAFHNNWESVSSTSFYRSDTNVDELLAARGFNPIEGVTPAELTYSERDQEPLPSECVEILDDMVALARENDVTLVFFTAPYAYRGTFNFAAAMREYATENGCYYVNLFEHLDEMGMSGETDFADVGHLNTAGAEKVTDFLGQYLRDEGLIPAA